MVSRFLTWFLVYFLQDLITKLLTLTTMTTDNVSNIPRDDTPLTRDNWSALFWLLVFSTAMFTLPFAAFFLVRHYLKEYFELDVFAINCGGVLAAVITVNLVIVAYAIKGYREVEKEHLPSLDSDSTATTSEVKKNK